MYIYTYIYIHIYTYITNSRCAMVKLGSMVHGHPMPMICHANETNGLMTSKDGVCLIQLLAMAHGTWQKPPNYGKDVFKSLLIIICEKNNHQKSVWKPNMYGASIIALFSHSILFLLLTADFTQHPWCWGSLICICSTIKDRFNHIHSHPSRTIFRQKV